MIRTAQATVDPRASRLHRALKRLGYDLIDAERGNYPIRRSGSKVNETADPLDLTGVERWIRERVKRGADVISASGDQK